MSMDPEPSSARLSLSRQSEPESGQQVPSTAGGSPAVASITRSCFACNAKKVRCDKERPCSSCKRSGKSCSYPLPGPRIRRSKKTIMAEMASRISSLEKSLAKATDGRKTSQPSRRSSISENTTSSAQTARETPLGKISERAREDILVQKGSSSQYFNEVLLSRVIEEERNIESVLTTPATSTGSLYPPISPFNALGILSSPFPSQAPSSFHPPKSVAVRLWNIYVNNVEGCAGLRLLHLPTDEFKVYSTIDKPPEAPFENIALCLAIYFAATVSLDDEEAQAVFEQGKCTHLLSFKYGLEQAFAQGDFLDRPTLTGLHALAIYLSALRVHNHGKGIWILNGLAIRIAESLGLHRDGERLGISPFQSEIRRRLWWHLLSRDGRAGEDYGLETTKGMLLMSDVSLPLNVDDANLYPEMKELPPAKEGWTSMTFSLINIELVKSMQKLAAIAASSLPSSSPSEDVRVQIINDTRARIEERTKFCNPVIPQHRLTIFCSRFLLRKLDFISRQQWLLLQLPGSLEDFTTEENLIEALEILEPRLVSEDDLLKQFAWARKAYPQYHVTMYILWHLCVKPEGPSVERAWKAVETVFGGEQWNKLTSGFGSKAAVLEALRAKVVSVREKIRDRDLVGSVRNSDKDLGLETKEDTFDGTVPAYLLEDIGTGELSFDIDSDEWPNWATLAQGFQPDGQAFPGGFWQ